jgi:hypothetical protein
MKIPEGHKKCTKCLEVKAFSEFHKAKQYKDGLVYNCKDCAKQRVSIWQKNNPEKCYKKYINYVNKTPKYRETKKKKIQEYKKKERENLDDRYIKETLMQNNNLKASDIPQEMIEVKRMQLMIRRQLKEMKNERSNFKKRNDNLV